MPLKGGNMKKEIIEKIEKVDGGSIYDTSTYTSHPCWIHEDGTKVSHWDALPQLLIEDEQGVRKISHSDAHDFGYAAEEKTLYSVDLEHIMEYHKIGYSFVQDEIVGIEDIQDGSYFTTEDKERARIAYESIDCESFNANIRKCELVEMTLYFVDNDVIYAENQILEKKEF